MRSSISFVSLFFVFVVGCVGEHAKGDDAGSGSQESPIAPDWVTAPYVSQIAVDASHVYFVSGGGAELSRVATTGGAPESLYQMPSGGTAFDMIDALVVGPNDIAFVVDSYDTDTLEQTRTLYALAKSGGTPRMLASSQDTRAYLGVTIDGDYVYFTSFTSLVRVPLAGGASQFIGESPNSVRYWAFTPTVVGDTIYWAESSSLFSIAKGDADQEGTLFASLPGSGKIIASGSTFVVTLSTLFDDLEPATSFVEVDAATGQAGSPIEVGAQFDDAAVTGESVWAATAGGLVRVPRAGGAPEQVTTTQALSIAAGSDAIFVGTEAGITRAKLP